MTFSQQRMTLSSGITLPYVEPGDPDGMPVVLRHGFTDSWRSWELLLGVRPGSLHAYAPTQRGHGDADHPLDGYGVDDYVADIADFMDAVGVEDALIVGHSGGSYTAQRFALDHPERTLGLVLAGAFRAFAGNAAVRELTGAVRQLGDPVDRGFIREFQESCVAGPVPDGFLDAIIAESAMVPARVWNAYLDGILDAEVPTEAGTIAAPALILWGDQDACCPRADQDALVAAIPGARLAVYPGTGHCPHWEQAGRVARDIVTLAAAPAVRHRELPDMRAG